MAKPPVTTQPTPSQPTGNKNLVNHNVHNAKAGVADALEQSAKARIQYDR